MVVELAVSTKREYEVTGCLVPIVCRGRRYRLSPDTTAMALAESISFHRRRSDNVVK